MPQTFGGYPVHSPDRVRAARRRFRRGTVEELGLANSLTVTSGRWPAAGWFLMTRQDFNKLDPYSTDLTLVIDDFASGTLTLKHLTVVQARSVSTGLTNANDALYLVQATDKRGVLYNPWYAHGTTSQYNVPAPAYPGLYYTESLLGGVTAWTWSEMIEDLWEQMPLLGTFPGLPLTPSGTPQSFIFPGGPAWEALSDVLDLLGMTVAVDLTSDTPYTVVSSGAADGAFTAQQTLYAKRLEDDMEWLDAGSGRVPGTVVVLFHRVNQYFGTEETVTRGSTQWSSTPSYAVTVPSPAPFDRSEGTALIWDDFIVRYDQDGVPLAADVTLAAGYAQDRVTEFFNKIYSGTSGYLSQTYAGALPFTTGSQVDGVRWQQFETERLAWRTSLSRGWIWNDVVFSREPETIVGTRDSTD